MVPMGLGSLVCPIGWGKLLSSPQTTLANHGRSHACVLRGKLRHRAAKWHDPGKLSCPPLPLSSLHLSPALPAPQVTPLAPEKGEFCLPASGGPGLKSLAGFGA